VLHVAYSLITVMSPPFVQFYLEIQPLNSEVSQGCSNVQGIVGSLFITLRKFIADGTDGKEL